MKNKISTKIIMAIVSCSVLVSAIVGIANSMKSSSIIKAEANDTLLNLASSRGNEYNIQIVKVENTVKELSGIVVGTLDTSKVKDSNYMNKYEQEISSLIKNLGDSNKGIIGLYINFDPKFTGGT